MSLAGRNLAQDKLRLALSVGGVALAVALILILNSFLIGINQQISAYLQHTPGSVVVAQKGVTNFVSVSTSLLPSRTDETVINSGVAAEVVPLLSQFVILDLHGKKQFTSLIGYEPALGGGPWKLAAGREPQNDSEVVVDATLARLHQIQRGDTFELKGQTFTVVGLSRETISWMTNLVFVRKPAAEALLRVPDATSYLLVTPAPGISPSEARDRLRDVPGTEVLLKSEMLANDLGVYGRVFNAPLRLMIGIAFLVGVLVVGLVIYTATIERQREYGVLKAIGARNWLLYRVVTAQALVASVSGALLGIGLAFGATRLIMALRPQFVLALDPAALATALLAGLGMAVVAALFPARAVARLAPADVFRR